MEFKAGDIVEAIEVDWFHPELMPIGSKWVVHAFHAEPGRELLTLFPHADHPLADKIIEKHRAGLSPWAKKFRHWEPETKMVDYADVYDEIMRAQELIQR